MILEPVLVVSMYTFVHGGAKVVHGGAWKADAHRCPPPHRQTCHGGQ
jgi:hypothetical protein